MNVIAHIVAYVMFIIYMLPIINVLVFSFTDGLTIKTGVIRKDSFTLENYKKLFRSATAYKPYLVSIVYSLLAALVVAVICIVVARIVTKAKHKYDKLFEPFILIPWLLPSTMIALGLMLTYDEPRMLLADKVLVATPIILLFAYIIIKIPFSYRMIRAGFVGLDGNMEEAAQVMGAKPLYTMRKVILPIIMPIVLSVIVLNFNGLLSEYDLSVFLYHPSYQPLGIVIKLATDETATDAFRKGDLHMASKVEPLETVVDELVRAIKARHVARLQTGSCSIEYGFVLEDLLTNYERVCDHCSNVAVAQIEVAQDSFDTHAYLNDLRYGNETKESEQFQRRLDRYRERYLFPDSDTAPADAKEEPNK